MLRAVLRREPARRALAEVRPREHPVEVRLRPPPQAPHALRQVVAREELGEGVRHVALEQRRRCGSCSRRGRGSARAARARRPTGPARHARARKSQSADWLSCGSKPPRASNSDRSSNAVELHDTVSTPSNSTMSRSVSGPGRIATRPSTPVSSNVSRSQTTSAGPPADRGGGELALELLRRPRVVGVEERDVAGARGRGAAVARRRDARVRLLHEADRVAEAPHHLGRRVRRAVVDHDALGDRVRLGEHALDRVGDERRAVVDGDDRRDRRLGRGARLTSPHGAGTPRASAASTARARGCARRTVCSASMRSQRARRRGGRGRARRRPRACDSRVRRAGRRGTSGRAARRSPACGRVRISAGSSRPHRVA